mmetsp:Transcript_25044/g.54127  ORF Transcript_25044/g.54127 Transcript_25044/m.54127 type:complete len:257 (-) Transcript_25044:81-851(-)
MQKCLTIHNYLLLLLLLIIVLLLVLLLYVERVDLVELFVFKLSLQGEHDGRAVQLELVAIHLHRYVVKEVVVVRVVGTHRLQLRVLEVGQHYGHIDREAHSVLRDLAVETTAAVEAAVAIAIAIGVGATVAVAIFAAALAAAFAAAFEAAAAVAAATAADTAVLYGCHGEHVALYEAHAVRLVVEEVAHRVGRGLGQHHGLHGLQRTALPTPALALPGTLPTPVTLPAATVHVHRAKAESVPCRCEKQHQGTQPQH